MTKYHNPSSRLHSRYDTLCFLISLDQLCISKPRSARFVGVFMVLGPGIYPRETAPANEFPKFTYLGMYIRICQFHVHEHLLYKFCLKNHQRECVEFNYLGHVQF